MSQEWRLYSNYSLINSTFLSGERKEYPSSEKGEGSLGRVLLAIIILFGLNMLLLFADKAGNSLGIPAATWHLLLLSYSSLLTIFIIWTMWQYTLRPAYYNIIAKTKHRSTVVVPRDKLVVLSAELVPESGEPVSDPLFKVSCVYFNIRLFRYGVHGHLPSMPFSNLQEIAWMEGGTPALFHDNTQYYAADLSEADVQFEQRLFGISDSGTVEYIKNELENKNPQIDVDHSKLKEIKLNYPDIIARKGGSQLAYLYYEVAPVNQSVYVMAKHVHNAWKEYNGLQVMFMYGRLRVFFNKYTNSYGRLLSGAIIAALAVLAVLIFYFVY